ncbi:ABC transporter substrate-binding protein [Silvibacterium acidisoli]|uniref:ABC transporter substrate-binding protein n=1 Tax=Acidobacteriaceae bacterium ZG23-2 TaxID=2883246 RepID=UPI00406CF8D8
MSNIRSNAWALWIAVALSLIVSTARSFAESQPQRIVSTAPSITETLFALGLGDRVVGVSRFCNYPPEVQKLPRVGSYLKPDAEAIARLSPDLVVLQRIPNELTDRLDALHIRFVQVPHGTLEDVYTAIQLVASAAGVPERSAALTAQIKTSLAQIQSRANATPSRRVLIIVDRLPGTLDNLVATGPNNYVNEILRIAGGTNVLAKPAMPQYPRISFETVLRENPDVIIDLSGTQETEAERKAARAATVALWNQHPELAAVRAGRVYPGTSDSLVVPGPRTPLAAQRLFEFVHGTGPSE